jgi:hypothetical protein
LIDIIAITPLRHFIRYAISHCRHYAITPLRHYYAIISDISAIIIYAMIIIIDYYITITPYFRHY